MAFGPSSGLFNPPEQTRRESRQLKFLVLLEGFCVGPYNVAGQEIVERRMGTSYTITHKLIMTACVGVADGLGGMPC